jgi:GNAT superfamily N-acetyltransferase
MAAFEGLTVSATEESLADSLFGAVPAAHSLLLFAEEKPIGYAVYFFSFSTMEGKRSLWLEDLFIDAAFRGNGFGQLVMAHLADVAIRHNCARFEWVVLDWNERAIRFYRRLGAAVLPDWRICRVEASQLADLARQAGVKEGDRRAHTMPRSSPRGTS